MGQHLAESFVDLRRFGFAAEAIPKLRLDHVERRFDVRPLVISRHEVFLIVGVPVIHAKNGARAG